MAPAAYGSVPGTADRNYTSGFDHDGSDDEGEKTWSLANNSVKSGRGSQRSASPTPSELAVERGLRRAQHQPMRALLAYGLVCGVVLSIAKVDWSSVGPRGAARRHAKAAAAAAAASAVAAPDEEALVSPPRDDAMSANFTTAWLFNGTPVAAAAPAEANVSAPFADDAAAAALPANESERAPAASLSNETARERAAWIAAPKPDYARPAEWPARADGSAEMRAEARAAALIGLSAQAKGSPAATSHAQAGDYDAPLVMIIVGGIASALVFVRRRSRQHGARATTTTAPAGAGCG